MAIVSKDIEHEFLVRWNWSLVLADGSYQLIKNPIGAQVNKVRIVFDDQTGDVLSQKDLSSFPVKNVAGVSGGDDIETFAISDVLSSVQSDALSSIDVLNEELKSEKAKLKDEKDICKKKDEEIASLSARISELESKLSGTEVNQDEVIL